jgi:hypothetical protein
MVFEYKALHRSCQLVITSSSKWRLYQIACSCSPKSGMLLRDSTNSRTILTLSCSPGSKPLLSWRTNLLFCGEMNSVSIFALPRSRFETSYGDDVSDLPWYIDIGNPHPFPLRMRARSAMTCRRQSIRSSVKTGM